MDHEASICLFMHARHKSSLGLRAFPVRAHLVHGQENANVIGEGGAVDLTENPSVLRRWMVAGLELSRMIQEFEVSNNQTEENDHHEQKSGIQKALRRTEYTIFIQELGNPFPRGRRKPDGDSYLGYYG